MRISSPLRVQAPRSLFVDVVEQMRVPLPNHAARFLDPDARRIALRRRALLRADDPTLIAWEESYVLPERLPSGFMNVLRDNPQSVRNSLGHQGVAARHEIISHRLCEPPRWWPAPDSPPPIVMSLLYRAYVDDLPAVLISESFAIDRAAAEVMVLDEVADEAAR